MKRREKALVSVDDYVAAIIACPWRRASSLPPSQKLAEINDFAEKQRPALITVERSQ